MAEEGKQEENQRAPDAAERGLREAMRHFPGGVTIVTAGSGETAEGMTASAVISVSLDPPLMLVSVQRDARVNARIRDSGSYALNLLASDQEGLSRLFASPERSGGEAAVRSLGGGYGATTGSPLASGSLATIECEVEEVYPGGDHDLFLGRVVAVTPGEEEKSPLVYHEGAYPRLVHDARPDETNAFMDSTRGFDARVRDFGLRRKRRRD